MFKRLFCWAYFQGSLFSEGLVIGRNFAFQNESGLTIKTANNTPKKGLKHLVHGLIFGRVYYRKGLFSEGILGLRFGGLIEGKPYFFYFFSFSLNKFKTKELNS